MDMLISGTGIYVGTSAPDQETCFLTEWYCLQDLLKGLETPCPCGSRVMHGNVLLFYRYFLLFDYCSISLLTSGLSHGCILHPLVCLKE